MKTMLTSTVDAIYTVADLMTAAALTAPKTSGQDKNRNLDPGWRRKKGTITMHDGIL